jgi:hypothetical protein
LAVASEWSFEHSVQARVTPEAAWAFWTTVSNWAFDTSLESVKLDGPFVAGGKGVTTTRGGQAIEWRIREASPGHALIEMPLPGALVAFRWTFVPDKCGTRITQRVTLSGPGADQHVGVAESQLAVGIPEGMRKLVEVMEHGSLR